MTDDRLRFDDLQAALRGLASQEAAIASAAQCIASALSAGGCVLTAGNGGSATQAQHLAAELIGRVSASRARPPLSAVALTSDSAVLTALANDYGYDQVFARQVEALGSERDVLVVLSTSGTSANLLEAVAVGRTRGVTSIGLLGRTRSALHDACDLVIAVQSDCTQTIQEAHLAIVHVVVEMVEDRLSGVT